MGRTTVGDVTERIRRQLSSALRWELNVLAANVDADDTVLTLSYEVPPSLKNGAVLSVGQEEMRVLAVNAGAREVTVLRGWRDSTGEAHAAGAEIWLNPRFTGVDISEALHDEIRSWPQKLYRIDGDTFSLAVGAQTLELPAIWADLYGVVSARRQASSESSSQSWPAVDLVLQRGANFDGATTSGVLARFLPNAGGGAWAGCVATSVQLDVALPFDLSAWTLATDLVADVGLQASMIDLAEMGVKLRLLPDAEVGRSQRRGQDDERRAADVPVGAALAGLQIRRDHYNRRRNEEAARLQARYPLMAL